MKVLIVDDQNESRYLLETLFKGNGYEVKSAANGEEALERIAAGEIDLIVSDVLMPVMDGFQLCRKVKNDDRLRHIPFIIYTATYTGPQDEEFALKIGADRFIVKPCEPDVFMETVREVMASARRGHAPSAPGPATEDEVLKLYNERLVRKLEQKMLQLEQEAAARQETEERYRIITENMSDTVWLMDMNFKTTYISPSVERTRGFTLAELQKMPLEENFAPASWQTITRAIAEELTPQRLAQKDIKIERTLELEFTRKNGPAFWNEATITLVRDPEGKPMGFVGVGRDITERRRAEDKLIASEARYRRLFEAARDGILILDTDTGQIIDVNPFLVELLGYSRDDFLGKELWNIGLFKDIADSRDAFSELQAKGYIRYEDLPLQTRDGRRIDVEFVSNVYAANDTKVIQCNIRDVTERKRAEEALRESEARNRAMLEANPDMMFLLDRDYTFIDYRASSADELLASPADFLGKKISDVFPEQLARQHITLINSVIETGELQAYEYQLLFGNETRMFEARLARSGPNNVLAVVRDVTERRRLEEQLHQAMKMEAIGRLAGGVAHDFNNALTPMMAISDILLKHLSPDHPMHEDLKDINDAAQRCAGLTRQLLAFSRRQPMEMKVINLNNVVTTTEKMLARVIGEDIKLVKFLQPDLGNVKADVGQIEQIIANLAVNARDAMPQGGKLTIETANVDLGEEYAQGHVAVTPGPHVMLAISDTGQGMDEQTRAHIFEPFFTTKAKGVGTGLGLSTVYGIVKQSGGNIWCYSEPGKGTTFKIYLPRVDEGAEKLKSREQIDVGSRRGSETILLVEDENSVRKVVGRVLAERCYKVMEAASGEEAVKICAEYRGTIHLMVTDVVMPGMSGKEAAGKIANSRPEMKIIYMSGYTDNAIVHHGVLDEGANFIQKPFTAEALAHKVRKVLDGD